ncbi:protein OS-9 isoform X3 [Lathamus discolor]|uniref:protein OS-9 isoform X3 n=1 Tax=Lathamus discolor TaxID=678569 RepID=UPI0032B7A7A6
MCPPTPPPWAPPSLDDVTAQAEGHVRPREEPRPCGRGLNTGDVTERRLPITDGRALTGRHIDQSLLGTRGRGGGRGEVSGGSGSVRRAKMAARRGRGPGPGPLLLSVLAVLGPALRGARAALDLQELGELKYGLEILAEPVLAGQRPPGDVVTVASKFKQRYECRLPAAAVRSPPDPLEEAQLYNGSGVSELLQPMAAAPCLLKTKDWWTYEFCYGKHVQQYHVEESEIKGDILFLGYYQSAFDWDDETAKASKQHRLKRYHSQSYVNGSRCDLTGRAREAEVRFLCEEGAGDHLARVDEPQSCSYVLTVHTPRICHHPLLRPSPAAAPQPILCQPALSPAQYVQYVQAQVSDTKRKVEEISEELKTLDTRLWSERDVETPGNPPEGAPVAHGDATSRDEADPAKEQGQEATSEDGGHQDSTRAEEPSPRAAGDRVTDPRKKIHFKVIRSLGDLLQFIEELKESSRKAKEKVSEEEEEVGEAAAKAPPAHEEPSVVGDKERPEEEEEDNEDEEDLLGGFEKELEAVLLPREQMAQLKEEVKTEMEKEFDNIINEVEDELETEGLKGEFDRTRASKSLASTLNRLMDKLDGGGEREEEDGAGRKSRSGQQEPPQGHPQSDVRELLAKEGLRAEGKIEIKIVTAGGDEAEGRWLSEEDTKNLKEIFFNVLLQGSPEVHRERRRHQALQDNYRFVWGGRREPPPTGDSEDPDL